jgi:hypothetical protein
LNWQAIFAVTNAIALIGWLLLLLAPRRPLTLSLVLYVAVGLLCLIYAVLLIALLGAPVDPVPAPGAKPASLADYSVRGLAPCSPAMGRLPSAGPTIWRSTSSPACGSRATRDGKGVGRLLQAPVLLATYLAGPLGLLIWLVAREPLARRQARNAS